MNTIRNRLLKISSYTLLLPALTVFPCRAEPSNPLASLSWKQCYSGVSSDLRCAYLDVPLNHNNIEDEHIKIAVIKLQASDQENKIGTLIANPGGPGGSGVDFVRIFGNKLYSEDVRKYYDIVSFDPRGIKRSHPLSCLDSYLQYFQLASGPKFPVDEQDIIEWTGKGKYLSELCTKNADKIINHMSTADVAKDMEFLRKALKIDSFSFVGYSYGTYLGITYASLFPTKLDKLVLDSVIPPQHWATGQGFEGEQTPLGSRLKTAQGTENTLQYFFELCEESGVDNCDFAPNTEERFYQLRTHLLNRYKNNGYQENVLIPNYNAFISTVVSYLYNSTSWPSLSRFLAQTETAIKTENQRVEGTADLNINQAFINRENTPSNLIQQTIEATPAVICADTDNPSDLNTWKQVGFEENLRYPLFGAYWHWADSVCATWPGSKESRYKGPFSTTTQSGTLVINNLYDPATPYFSALDVRNNNPNSRIISINGGGHIGMYLSTCADNAVARYLLSGEMPNSDLLCQQDTPVFIPDPVTNITTSSNTKSTPSERSRYRQSLMNFLAK